MDVAYHGFKIVSDGTYSQLLIKPPKQGKIPFVLEGYWTSVPVAKNAIDAYLGSLSKAGRNKRNGKEQTAPTS